VSQAVPPYDPALELLRRLHRTNSLPEAFSVLIDAVLQPRALDRALVLTEQDGALRSAIGIGWPDKAVRALAVPLDDELHPLTAALLRGEPAVLEPGALEGPFGERALGVVPIAGNERAFALLLLDATGHEPEEIEDVAEMVREAGPVIERRVELDTMRASLRQAEWQRELLTSIINALPDPVLITDPNNRVILENRRAESLFTSADADSEGRRRALEINNLLFSSFLTRSTIGGPDDGARELNLVDPSEGGDLLFEVLSSALPHALSREGAVVSVLRDVTDLKRATTELEHQFKRVRHAEIKSRRERDRLNLILENVGDPILVTDEASNIILMNREAERLFEVPPGADLRSRQRREVRANDTKFSSFISDLALSPDTTRIGELQLAEPETGRAFPAEVVSGKILNDRSELTAIVSILHDLTKVVENERLAAELARLNEGLEGRVRAATAALEERNHQLEWQSRELERAYRLKSQFLASMSHELRTPINALLGYTSLMRDRIYGDLTTRQDEALGRMYNASQHLLELVNDILDLAKIEAGKMPVHIEPVDVGQLVRELSLTIEPMVRQKALAYESEVAPNLPVVRTDPTKVKQILLNLLSNAVKFTHEGAVRVHVHRAEAGDGIEVAISDTGIGIAAEDLTKIFDDFRQVDQSSTREYGGTGLGLSITKKLLHLLGGSVRVHSEPGHGSTFTVWLPSRSEEHDLEEQIAQATREPDEAVVAVEVGKGAARR
jgi:PAS domain S-box-containing protein